MEQQNINIFTEPTVVYAGFWERFAAAFIDGIIVSIVATPLALLVSPSFMELSILGRLIQLVIYVAYFGYFESSAKQATWGKQALKIKVTTLEGGRISVGQAVGRYFGRILSTIILLIGYFMMLWDDKKQTLHDRLAGTLVVKS